MWASDSFVGMSEKGDTHTNCRSHYRCGLLCDAAELHESPDVFFQAMDQPDPFENQRVLHEDLREAMEWHAARSSEQVIAEREKITRRIENAGSCFSKTPSLLAPCSCTAHAT